MDHCVHIEKFVNVSTSESYKTPENRRDTGMVQCILPVALLAETLRNKDDGAVTQCPVALLDN